MSKPACTACQDVLSCGDSPFSITGNVIGILTFAAALLISIQVYVNLMRSVGRNILEITQTFRSRVDEVIYLEDKLERRQADLDGELGERVRHAMYQARQPIEKPRVLLEQLDNNRYDGSRRLWARVRLLCERIS
jgi:hypothetical protein